MHHENEKRTTTTTTTIGSSSSSTTRAHARTRETEINVAIAGLRELYQDAIGQPMSDICERALRRDLEKGVPYLYFHYALEETAFAPRPSWRYTLAIVRRLLLQEVDEESLLLSMSMRD